MEWTLPTILAFAACLIAAYLLGSINFAIIVTRMFGKGDIRQYGSGNAGMTNVLRTVGKTAAALTLLGDFSKGIVSILILRLVMGFCGVADTSVISYFAALAALMGHLFPIFYRFKGGKGILVSGGSMLILCPFSLLLCCIGFFAVAIATRYVSAGSITAGAVYPFGVMLATWLFGGAIHWPEVAVAALIGIVVILMHHQNIKRLLNGTENKVSFKK